MMANEKLLRQVQSHPYPLVFATVSGAHLYGFPSPDSDRRSRSCPKPILGFMRASTSDLW